MSHNTHQVSFVFDVQDAEDRNKAALLAFAQLAEQIARGRVTVSVKDAAGMSRDVEIDTYEDMNAIKARLV